MWASASVEVWCKPSQLHFSTIKKEKRLALAIRITRRTRPISKVYEGQADKAQSKDHSKGRHFKKDDDQKAYEAGYQKGRN